MTPEELKRLKEICDRATEAVWVNIDGIVEDKIGHSVANCFSTPSLDGRSLTQRKFDNAEFIVEARTAMPKLIAEVERLREVLEFYADKSNWVSRTGKMGISPIDTIDRNITPGSDYPWAGGKHAREALGEKK